MLNFSESKLLYKAGAIERFKIEKSLKGWKIFFEGSMNGYLCDTRENLPRDFKTLDSCFHTLQTIGFTIESLR